MGFSVPIIQCGSLAKPAWAKESRLKLSAYAKQLGCVGVILWNEGNPLGAVIGPDGPYAKMVNTSAVNALSSTSEGYCYLSGAFRSSAATLPVGPIVDGVSDNSSSTVIARVKCPAGNGGGDTLVWQSTGGAGGVSIGFDSTDHPFVGSSGNSGVGRAISATVYADQFITIGAQCDRADAHPNLFINGVFNATQVTGSGSNARSGNLYLNMGNAGNAFLFSYVLLFRKFLSDQEHFFVARNPWSLLEMTGVLGKTFGGGNVYSVGIVESASAADTVSDTATLPSTIAETGSAVETVSTGAIYTPNIAESASAADIVSDTATLPSAIAEAGTAAETVSDTAILPSAISEAGSAADTPSSKATLPSAIIEAGAAADTVSNIATLPNTITETANAQDTEDAPAPGGVNIIVENVTAVDTVSAKVISNNTITDTLTATNTQNSTALLPASVAETASAADSLSAKLLGVASVAENAALTDAYISQLLAKAAIIEAANAQDTLTVSLAVLTPSKCDSLKGPAIIRSLVGPEIIRSLIGGCGCA